MWKGNSKVESEDKKVIIKKGFLNDYMQSKITWLPKNKLPKLNSYECKTNASSGIEGSSQNSSSKKIDFASSIDKSDFSPVKMLQSDKISKFSFPQMVQFSSQNVLPSKF